MIQPISICSFKTNPAFRNTPTAAQTAPIQENSAVNDFKTYLEEKDKREKQNMLAGYCFSGAVILGTMLLLPKIAAKAGKHTKTSSGFVRGFESLRGDKNIPTLDSCKSINNKLKEFLQNQVDYAKATPEDLIKTGTPQAENRLLMYGAPGSGKSYFAKILAKTLDADYMEIKYSDLNKQYCGEHLENMKGIFEDIITTAQNSPDKRFVVNFNEIDSLAQSAQQLQQGIRSGSHNSFKLEERSVFLTYIEDLAAKTPNVTLVGSTNIQPRNGGLDGAVLSRFKNVIEVPYPDKKCLNEALIENIKTLPEGSSFIEKNKKELDKFAQSLVDRKASFRDLNDVVEKSKNYYLRDTLKDKNSEFKFEYLEKARNAIEATDGELNGI